MGTKFNTKRRTASPGSWVLAVRTVTRRARRKGTRRRLRVPWAPERCGYTFRCKLFEGSMDATDSCQILSLLNCCLERPSSLQEKKPDQLAGRARHPCMTGMSRLG